MIGLLLIVGALAQGLALMFGGWMLLGATYGQPVLSAAGAVLVAAPAVLTIGGAVLSWRLRRRGSPRAGLAAGLPLGLLLVLLGAEVVMVLTIGH